MGVALHFDQLSALTGGVRFILVRLELVKVALTKDSIPSGVGK